MRIKQNTQWVDTCGCKLVYEFDADLDDADVVHKPVSITPCSIHAPLGDSLQTYEIVKKENEAKNDALRIIAQEVVELSDELTGENGEKFRVYKQTTDGRGNVTGTTQPQWYFDNLRNLHIVSDLLSTAKKQALSDLKKTKDLSTEKGIEIIID